MGVPSSSGLLVLRAWGVAFDGAVKWSRMSVQVRLSVVGAGAHFRLRVALLALAAFLLRFDSLLILGER